MLLFGPLLPILLFRFVPVPLTPLMVVRLVQGYGLHHEWVPYERIAPALVQAVVASEDNLFCREPLGIDAAALLDQVAIWREGERPRGASTITMQTTRNLLLWPGRDMVRKALEIWLTPQVALLWPKRRILEVYLNSIEFGPGVYGAEAAARPRSAVMVVSCPIVPAGLVRIATEIPIVRNPDATLESAAPSLRSENVCIATQIAPRPSITAAIGMPHESLMRCTRDSAPPPSVVRLSDSAHSSTENTATVICTVSDQMNPRTLEMMPFQVGMPSVPPLVHVSKL